MTDKKLIEDSIDKILRDGQEWRHAGQVHAIHELRRLFNNICDLYLNKLDKENDGQNK